MTVDDMEPKIPIEIGMRVHVLSVERKPLGLGTIIAVDELCCEGVLLCADYPTIKLDTGEELGGMECWWTPVIEEEVN